METGEYDHAWNLQLAPEVIKQMAEGGKGKPVSGFSTAVERLEMNMTNPSADLDADTRSTRKAPSFPDGYCCSQSTFHGN